MRAVASWLSALSLAAVALLAACAGQTAATVRVAAAASLRYAFDEVIGEFTGGRSGVRVEVSYGSSGSLHHQVANGAPYDLYLAADVGYVDKLVKAGVAGPEDRFHYARGRLVVWAGDGSPVDPAGGIAAVRDAARVAIANPAHAPYGQAAVAVLKAAGVYAEVSDRLVLGDNVAQAAEFVAGGNAEVGVVAMSLVRAPELRDVGRWQEVPPDLFPPVEQAGLVLPAGSGSTLARALRDLLTAPAGQEILRRYGFAAPVE